MKEIEEMTKDELEAYALEKFNVDLNKRKSLESLVAQVNELEGNDTAMTVSDELVVLEPDYLRHPINNRVFPSTKFLLMRGDMIPCDKDGKTV